MFKKALLFAILVEIGLFYYFFQEKETRFVADAPGKYVDAVSIQRDMPAASARFTHEVHEALEASNTQESLQAIKSSYETKFETLEEDAYRQFFDIVTTAYTDYQKNRDKQATASYIAQLEKLKNETEHTFNEIYEQLKDELAANGYPPSEAEKYKKTYEEKKQIQMRELLKLVQSTIE